jgi:hypothetical protein
VRAIKNFFGKSNEESASEEAANAAALNNAKNMSPSELANRIKQGLQKVNGVFLSPDSAKAMADDVNKIADAFSSFGNISPLEFYDTVILNNKAAFGGCFNSVIDVLKNFGIQVSIKNKNGESESVCEVISGETVYRTEAKDTMKNAAAFFGVSSPSQIDPSNAAQYIASMESFLSPNGSIRQKFKQGRKNLEANTAKLEELLKVFENEKEVEKIVAQRASGWIARGVQSIKNLVGKDPKALSSAEQVRVRVKVAKDVGKAVASALKTIAKALNESAGLYKVTAASLREIIDAKVARQANKDQQELDALRNEKDAAKKQQDELQNSTSGAIY